MALGLGAADSEEKGSYKASAAPKGGPYNPADSQANEYAGGSNVERGQTPLGSGGWAWQESSRGLKLVKYGSGSDDAYEGSGDGGGRDGGNGS